MSTVTYLQVQNKWRGRGEGKINGGSLFFLLTNKRGGGSKIYFKFDMRGVSKWKKAQLMLEKYLEQNREFPSQYRNLSVVFL